MARPGFYLFHNRKQTLADAIPSYVGCRIAAVEVRECAKGLEFAGDDVPAPGKVDADDTAMCNVALAGFGRCAVQLQAEIEDIIV